MKDFILIGFKCACQYNEVFPYIRDRKVWIGYNEPRTFKSAAGYKNITCNWYSTIEVKKKIKIFKKCFDPSKYITYENYPAINVDRLADIPYDYNGKMGVPITFLDNPHPDYKIIQLGADYLDKCLFQEFISQGYKTHYGKKLLVYRKDGKLIMPYCRVIIKKL